MKFKKWSLAFIYFQQCKVRVIPQTLVDLRRICSDVTKEDLSLGDSGDAITFPTRSSIKLTSELCSYTKPILRRRSSFIIRILDY